MKAAGGGAVFPPLSQWGGELAGHTGIATRVLRGKIAAWRIPRATGGDVILSRGSYISWEIQDGVRIMYPEHPLGDETRANEAGSRP